MAHRGSLGITNLLKSLSPTVHIQLDGLLNDCRQLKNRFAEIVLSVGATEFCRDCRGQCCMNGKYRLTVFDALMMQGCGQVVRSDFSLNPLCPYGTSAGCGMEDSFRPLDCVLFICDMIDERLSNEQRTTLTDLEAALRLNRKNTGILLQRELSAPLLLWAEKPEADVVH